MKNEKIGTHEVHPAASVFPLIQGAEFDALVEDIRKHGQLTGITRIWADEGATRRPLILDGRNRLRACLKVGIDPFFEEFETDDPAGYVVSHNLKRRHLDESQRAMVASKLATLSDGHRQVGQLADVPTQAQAAAMVNVGERSVRRARQVLDKGTAELADAVEQGHVSVDLAAQLTKQDAPTQRKVVERVLDAKAAGKPVNPKQVARELTREAVSDRIRQEPPPLPKGRYRVLVVDPPWLFDLRDEDATHRGVTPYPPMTVPEIEALPIGDHATEDAVLFLWITNAHLLEGAHIPLLKAWGFEAKTIRTWVKDRWGAGHWLRGKTEHVILAVRGTPTVHASKFTTEFTGAVREHSRKPEAFYEFVEAYAPGSKLEWFAREQRQGWTVWGAEVGMFKPSPQTKMVRDASEGPSKRPSKPKRTAPAKKKRARARA